MCVCVVCMCVLTCAFMRWLHMQARARVIWSVSVCVDVQCTYPGNVLCLHVYVVWLKAVCCNVTIVRVHAKNAQSSKMFMASVSVDQH